MAPLVNHVQLQLVFVVCIYKGVLDPFFVGFRHRRVKSSAKLTSVTHFRGRGFVVAVVSCPCP
jgi:hypothetical protein